MPDARSLRASTFSVVAPCYNEEDGLGEFVRRIKAVCEQLRCRSYEIVLVNDGSRDRTLVVALEIADVAYGQRRTRLGESQLKLLTARIFYRLLRRMTKTNIPTDTGDFRLMDRRIVDALRQMRERHRFIRGMVSWVGGKQVAVAYDRRSRFAGTTKYPLTKMISFALDAITSFSVVPLRLVTYLALSIIAVTFIAGAALIVVKLINPAYFLPGFAATMITIIFFGGVQLLALGVIGEYIGRMYESVKARPIYLLEGIYQSGPDGVATVATAIEPVAPRTARVPVET